MTGRGGRGGRLLSGPQVGAEALQESADDPVSSRNPASSPASRAERSPGSRPQPPTLPPGFTCRGLPAPPPLPSPPPTGGISALAQSGPSPSAYTAGRRQAPAGRRQLRHPTPAVGRTWEVQLPVGQLRFEARGPRTPGGWNPGMAGTTVPSPHRSIIPSQARARPCGAGLGAGGGDWDPGSERPPADVRLQDVGPLPWVRGRRARNVLTGQLEPCGRFGHLWTLRGDRAGRGGAGRQRGAGPGLGNI